MTDESWDNLIPTIRKPGSEIWITFNPRRELDPTYQRFVKKAPPDAVVRKVSFRDNPFSSMEMRAEREYLNSVDPDAYAHIWEGECQAHGEAQIFYGKWRVQSFEPAKDWSGPYYGADWGFAQDPTALVKMWVHERVLYIEYEAWAVGCDIDKTPALFDQVPGSRKEIVRADNARPETISHMKQHGFPRMVPCEKWKGCVEDGIAHIRQYEYIVIHPRCRHAQQEARLYTYKIDRLTGNILAEAQDAHNHIWDSVRYGLEPLVTRQRSWFG